MLLTMKNNQIKKNHPNLEDSEEYILVKSNKIKSLYSKLIEYENKIILYKEILKKNMIVD